MKTLAITMGDPLGIGAEIIQKALPKFRDRARFKVFGDARLFEHLPPSEIFSIPTVDTPYTSATAGAASVACLDAAMTVWQRGEIDALVTAPISKAHVKAAGFAFPGHTEYLADKTHSQNFAMMMAGPILRVTLVTIHEPISRVASLLTAQKIIDTIAITHQGLKNRFGIATPKIAVCGLNPHAGEEGHLGGEEISLIAPAIEAARALGYPCEGPKVPDAVFHEAYQGQWDAVVCMYHDQGLIPFKMVHFRDGVNVTLGLPLVRTSPDHGTAFDIAGQGRADPASMEAAIELALRMIS